MLALDAELHALMLFGLEHDLSPAFMVMLPVHHSNMVLRLETLTSTFFMSFASQRCLKSQFMLHVLSSQTFSMFCGEMNKCMYRFHLINLKTMSFSFSKLRRPFLFVQFLTPTELYKLHISDPQSYVVIVAGG